MYEVFRLREEKESSANRRREGKKSTTREKLRNIFISGVHVLPGLLLRESSFSFFCPYTHNADNETTVMSRFRRRFRFP